jgi:hypothetical protein
VTEPADGKTGETAGLPFSQGRDFATLDAYLAHLERRGATGVPWYREVAPGVYELVSGRGRRPEAARVTRAELMQRFGFGGEANA